MKTGSYRTDKYLSIRLFIREIGESSVDIRLIVDCNQHISNLWNANS